MNGVDRATLLGCLDELLEPQLYQDYCPNGLQVAGRRQIRRVVTGVTACEALIDAAIEREADALLVHHGYFWKNEDPRIVGIKERRLRKLLVHGINLIAYHLPLDGHAEVGNNAQLCLRLGIENTGRFGPQSIAFQGRLGEAMTAERFAQRVATVLERPPLMVGEPDRLIETVGICSGGAQGYVDDAAELGLDLYLSGEISEQTTHSARENGLVYLAAGHHATERFGVQALGERLAADFDELMVEFVEIANPA
ncbi:MAG: Nif3-like dinuclear metal center hexameric protein [Halothiobacillaceae bacterium]